MSRVYVFSDTHLQAHSGRDPLLPKSWMDSPSPDLGRSSADLLASHMKRAEEGDAELILHLGDMFHFPTPENVALFRQAMDQCSMPLWLVPGNHDWFYPGQDGWEELRAQMMPRLHEVTGPETAFWCREFAGNRIIGLDNSTYFLSAAQWAAVQKELQTPGPIVVAMHIPLSLPTLRGDVIAKHGNPILMADPDGRTREGIDPGPTHEFSQWLQSDPRVKAVLSAHVHIDHVDEMANGARQWICEAAYRGGYRWMDVNADGVTD